MVSEFTHFCWGLGRGRWSGARNANWCSTGARLLRFSFAQKKWCSRVRVNAPTRSRTGNRSVTTGETDGIIARPGLALFPGPFLRIPGGPGRPRTSAHQLTFVATRLPTATRTPTKMCEFVYHDDLARVCGLWDIGSS